MLVEMLVTSYVFLVDLSNPHRVVSARCVVHQL